MQLTVPEAARLLQVNEETVYSWIQDRGLPASQFGGRYQLNRIWLLEWAHDKGIAVAMNADDRMPSLFKALQSGGQHESVAGGTAEAALSASVLRLPLPPEVDREYLIQMLRMRETQGSTGFGGGVAIPHSRGPILLHVPEPLVAVCYLGTPVDYGAPDGKPVSVLIVQVTPTVRVHLHLLARLGRMLTDGSFLELLNARAKHPQLLRRVQEVESSFPARAPAKPTTV